MNKSLFPVFSSDPLAGVRIVDFTQWVVGPWAPRLLAHFGAEVIKVERTDEYEGMRRSSVNPDGTIDPNRSGIFSNVNADKLSITLNTRHPEGLKLAERLIGMSDAVVENFSSGVMESWGLGWDRLQQLNPQLVYVSLSGFGHSGEWKGWRSYGPTAQAISGQTLASGLPGQPSAGWGFSYMDVMGGFLGALALSMGIFKAKQAKKGMYIDYSIAEGAMSLMGPFFLDFQANGRSIRRPDFPPGNRSIFPPLAPHNTYRCSGVDRVGQDYWCFIACETQAQFDALCHLMGRPELLTDRRFATNADRVQNQDALDAEIQPWTQARSRHEVMDLCQKSGIIAAAVQNGEDLIDHDPQLRHRGIFPVVNHPLMGPFKYEGYPVKLSRTPGRIRRHGPLWGEHNDYVFQELLALQEEEVTALRTEGVIG